MMNNIGDENNRDNNSNNNNNKTTNILKEVTSLSPPTNVFVQTNNNENSNNTILTSPDSINGAQTPTTTNNVNNTTPATPEEVVTVPITTTTDTATPMIIDTTTTTTTTISPTSNIPPKPKTQTKTTFTITQFSQRDKAFYTETRTLLDLTWKLYIFPKGNQSDKDIALFLDLQEVQQPGFPDIKANFTLEVVNQKNSENSITKVSDHIFNPKGVDWGFNKFMDIQQLLDPEQGFVLNDTIIINVEVVQAYPCSGSSMYDSKKVTGYVGLQNQGATCYMNSLLQALFHISPFRRAVYELPTVSDDPTKSISLALQRIFYKLQFGDKSVGTKELTKSFGWDTMDIFTQHDVQELNRVLCDNLNDKMKGTKAEGTVDDLFRGKIKNFIKCEKVSFESKSDEYFYDLSLNVKGCRDIISSFDKYTETERLDGSNQYFAEGFGLQNANKGVKFLSLPPVLNLHLKRFEYDPVKDENVKINDKYKFPDTLDLNCYLDEGADKSYSYIYTLQSVLIHSGDLHNGHYYSFIKSKDGDWLKFDDDEVTKSTFDRVSDASFGSDFGVRSGRSDTNAYMLVYFRNNCYDSLSRTIDESEIPTHLKTRIEKDEQKENEQTFQLRLTRDEDFIDYNSYDLIDFDRFPLKTFKKTQENMNVGHLKKQITTLYGIPVERQRIWVWTTRRNRTVRIERYPETDDTSLHSLRMRMNGDIKLHLEICFNPRPLNNNNNGNVNNVNGNNLLSGGNNGNGNGGGNNNGSIMSGFTSGGINQQSIGVVGYNQNQNQHHHQQHHNFNNNQQNNNHQVDNINSFFPKISRDSENCALLFFKYYDPETKSLKFLGSKILDIGLKASSIYPQLCQLAGLPLTTPLLVYEEITAVNIVPIRPNKTLAESEMLSGDILVFQKQIASPNKFTLPTVIDYFTYIVNTTVVKIKQVDDSSVSFNCELSKQMKYSEITQKIASTINANPDNIRLMCKQRLESPVCPIKPNDNIPLFDMLSSTGKLTDILYFEILNIPVKDCEIKRNFKISWQKPGSNEFEIISVWVLKSGNVNDLIKEFLYFIKSRLANGNIGNGNIGNQQTKQLNIEKHQQDETATQVVKDQPPTTQESTVTTTATINPTTIINEIDSSRIRILEIRGFRVEKILTDEEISSISDSSFLRAEMITDEELNPQVGEKVVFVVHYSREHNYPLFHGTPFTILYKPNETSQSLRSRLLAKLGGSVSNKEFSRWKISIIKNDKVDYIPDDGTISSSIDWSGINTYIGLEHPNNHAKNHHQKAIKILG